jgi:hypothetical protein
MDEALTQDKFLCSEKKTTYMREYCLIPPCYSDNDMYVSEYDTEREQDVFYIYTSSHNGIGFLLEAVPEFKSLMEDEFDDPLMGIKVNFVNQKEFIFRKNDIRKESCWLLSARHTTLKWKMLVALDRAHRLLLEKRDRSQTLVDEEYVEHRKLHSECLKTARVFAVTDKAKEHLCNDMCKWWDGK